MKSGNDQTVDTMLFKEDHSSEILSLWLKRSLDRTFGQLVDENISRLSFDESDLLQNASEEIFKNISSSAEMFSFRCDLERSIEVALSNIMEKEMYKSVDDFARVQTPQMVSAGVSKRSQSRMACLQSVLRTPLSEVVSNPTWTGLQKILCEELCHEDKSIFNLVLQVHARLLTSASPVAVKEGFLNLVEGLSLHYLSHHIFPDLPNTHQGLKFSNHTHYRIVQITQTMLSALCDAPKHWICFGEKRLEEMIDNFVDMLTMHTYNQVSRKDSKHVFYPSHIISTIDPEAMWCQNLMHAAFGREITLAKFGKTPSFMRTVVEDVLNWVDTHILEPKAMPTINELDSKGFIQANAIKFATFVHSLSIISCTVCFENGWKIFPIRTHLRDEPVTLLEIARLNLQFLHKLSDLHLPAKLTDIMVNAIAQIILSRGSNILYNAHDISQILMQPLSSSRTMSYESCKISVKILSKVADAPQGLNWLLRRSESSRKSRTSALSSMSSMNEQSGPASAFQRNNRRSSVRSVSPYIYSISKANIIIDFATSVMKNEELFASDPTYGQFTVHILELCCKLLKQHDGVNLFDASKSKLLQYTVTLHQSLIHNIKNKVATESSKLALNQQNIQRVLLQFHMQVASSPLGFKLLSKYAGMIENMLHDIMDTSNPLSEMDLWTNPDLRRLLQFTDATNKECLSVRRRLLSQALTHVFTTFENETSIITGSDQLQNKAVNDFKMQLLMICSSVQVLNSLLKEEEDGDDGSTDSTLVHGDLPRSLPQLLNAALTEYNPSDYLPHWLGLVSLQTLTQNTNFLVLLGAKLSFQDALLNLQSKNADEHSGEGPSSPGRDSTNVVWDECTLLRYQILKETYKMNEGPSRTLSRISSALSTTPLSPQPSCWPSRRVQTELQRFLHDTRPGLHDNTWLGHARRAYRISAHAEIKVSVLLDLLDQVQRCQPLADRPNRSLIWPKPDSTETFDSNIQDKLGVDFSLRYCCEQRIIQTPSPQMRDQLLLLIHQSTAFLQIEEIDAPFDWFVSSVFLLSGGNIDRSRCLLQRLVSVPATSSLWSNLAIALRHNDLNTALGHQLETIIAIHFPHAHHALQLAGVSWWWLSEQLIQQSLWPVLQIQQLAHAIALCILHSSDYQLLLRVALLAHLQPRLLQAVAQSNNILAALQKNPPTDFKICDYLPLMDRLAKLCRFSTNRDQT